MHKTYALILGVLSLAFLLRVLGQLLVALFHPGFLPPMDQWYSGLIPYPLLLLFQFFVLSFQFNVFSDIWRGAGLFAERKPTAGKWLCRFSYVYFSVMVLRYIITMTLYPDRRWLTGTIPIFFHCLLAIYLFVLGRYFIAADRIAAQAAVPDRTGT